MITTEIKVLAACGLAAGIALAAWTWQGDRKDLKAAKVETKQQAVVVKRQDEVITNNQAKDDKAAKVDHETQTKSQAVAVDAGVSLDAHRRLLDTLARVRADAVREGATRAGLAAQVAAATDSLGECSGRYTAVAKERDGLSIQVSGLLALVPPAQSESSAEGAP